MPRFHHVNLGVPVGGCEAEALFLTDLLGYQKVQLAPDATVGRWWFESDDGAQVHLSEDPDHRPAARAHVAIELGSALAGVQRALDESGVGYRTFDREDHQTIFCEDPAGNRWELRGRLSA